MRASVVVARRLSSCGSRALESRLSSCGAWASLLHDMGDLPGPGLKLVSPALAGGFLINAPPGKSPLGCFITSLGANLCLPACFCLQALQLPHPIPSHLHSGVWCPGSPDCKTHLYPWSLLRTVKRGLVCSGMKHSV